MAHQEKETSPPAWPENFSPEIQRVLDQTLALLSEQGEIKIEVDENGVAFNLENFTKGSIKLCVFPENGNSASVRLQELNGDNVLFGSKVQARIISGAGTVIFESERQKALLIDNHSITLVLKPKTIKGEISKR